MSLIWKKNISKFKWLHTEDFFHLLIIYLFFASFPLTGKTTSGKHTFKGRQMCFWHLPSRHLVRRGGKHQQSRNTTNIKHLQSDLWIGLETTAREKKTSLLELSTVPPPFMPVLSFSSLFFAHRRTATATCLGSLSGLFYFKSDLNPESLRSFFRVEKWRSLVQLQSPDLLRPPSPAFHLLLGS